MVALVSGEVFPNCIGELDAVGSSILLWICI